MRYARTFLPRWHCALNCCSHRSGASATPIEISVVDSETSEPRLSLDCAISTAAGSSLGPAQRGGALSRSRESTLALRPPRCRRPDSGTIGRRCRPGRPGRWVVDSEAARKEEGFLALPPSGHTACLPQWRSGSGLPEQTFRSCHWPRPQSESAGKMLSRGSNELERLLLTTLPIWIQWHKRLTVPVHWSADGP